MPGYRITPYGITQYDVANQDIHVALDGEEWTVNQPAGQAGRTYGSFRIRAHAEAFGRALAHRCKVTLIVHHPDGREARYGGETLTYPSHLA